MTTNPLISRFAGEPALVEPSQAAHFEACLSAVAAHPRAEEMTALASNPEFWVEDGGWCRPYIVRDGILQIPVKGVLLNNFPYQLYDWATGYEYIWEAFKRGCADYAIGAIRGIALVCDTPGGMVAGCFDARDKMVALKQQTGVPVAGFAHEMAYSAGYAMISVADAGQIYVSRTGGVGSIGVVTGHLSVAGAMEKAGLVFTYIYAGEGKVDGNPYEALSPQAKARIQARIDELYGIFVAAVAQSRGLDESFIRETLGAHSYTATQAVSNGLADSIGSLDDATSAFAGFLDDQSDNQGEEDMSTQDTSAVDQAAAIENAVAAARAEEQTRAAEAAAAAVAADRERQKAITGSEEAKGRERLASHIALNTTMSVEDAVAMLKASPKAADAAAGGPSFEQAMDNTQQPEVGGNSDSNSDEARANGDDVLAIINAVGLRGFRSAQK